MHTKHGQVLLFCMKIKKIGPRGGYARPKFYYVDPPLAVVSGNTTKQLWTEIDQFENTCKSLGCLNHFTVTSSAEKNPIKIMHHYSLEFKMVPDSSTHFETVKKQPNDPNSSRLFQNNAVLKKTVQGIMETKIFISRMFSK